MKKIIITILLLSLTGCTTSNLGGEKEKKIKESDILYIDIVDELVEIKDKDGKQTGEIKNKGKMKVIHYISDKVSKIKEKKINGVNYTEDLSKRTSMTREYIPDLLGASYKLIGRHVEFYIAPTTYLVDDNWYDVEVATFTIDEYSTTTAKSFIDFLVKEAIAVDYDSGAGDGGCYINTTGTWAGVRSSATCGSVKTGGSYLQAAIWVGDWRLGRLFYPVNTDAIPDGATINSATFNIATKLVYSVGRESVMVKSTQANGASLATTDFDEAGDLDNPDLISAALSAAGWGINTIREIPITDLTVVQKVGYTKMAIRDTEKDIGGTAPTDNKWIELYTSSTGGALYTPFLAVTYTEVTASTVTPPLISF